jgi:hypothetical protein
LDRRAQTMQVVERLCAEALSEAEVRKRQRRDLLRH